MRSLLLLVLPCALIGCAGTPPVEEAVQVAAVAPGTVCEREQSTGSRFINTRCRSAADREQDKRDVDAIAESARRTRPSGTPGR